MAEQIAQPQISRPNGNFKVEDNEKENREVVFKDDLERLVYDLLLEYSLKVPNDGTGETTIKFSKNLIR